ncbi:hypothetical protein pEaSNUABM46_00073 [Erwinia phage pEa_SNUABM_46]|nr:hypothetical protein pEaSNUABM45_00073 [Erwinia phage pEa_SNUABM_45]QYW04057.1 hypothetical protein pEaSNUABM46_00073 [Erwinia phage pEa_SNUABM_46]
MLNDAGPDIEFEAIDIEKYWQGRIYLEAGRLQDADTKLENVAYTTDTIKPYIEAATKIVTSKRELHEEGTDLPVVELGEGHTMSPYFVIVFCLMFEAEGVINAQTRNALKGLSQAERDKKIRIEIAGHSSKIGVSLLKELEASISDRFHDRRPDFAFAELSEPREKKPTFRANAHLKQGRVGRHSGNQRFNAKPQRQNFKGRGR